jgi:hypothetical protein
MEAAGSRIFSILRIKLSPMKIASVFNSLKSNCFVFCLRSLFSFSFGPEKKGRTQKTNENWMNRDDNLS